MKKMLQKGFTLVELLIVIGILGILIAAVLFTLNPAEGQRKARDVQRVKDLGTVQTILEQVVSANLLTEDLVVNSSSGLSDCATNWLTVDVCDYSSKIPVDPTNKSTEVAGADGTAGDCTTTDRSAADAYYFVKYDSATNTYEINARQESLSGCSRLEGDGGNSDKMIEVGTSGQFTLLGDDGEEL
jgi:prepilin-type N-terminal cleavage/methylation domain-containing protein